MREAPILRWPWHDRDFAPYHLYKLEHGPGIGIEIMVQVHIEQRHFELAHGLHTALEIPGREHFVEQGTRQRLAGVHVGAHVLQHIPLPAEVFHELARQLDRVPFHAFETRNSGHVDLRQQQIETMSELMKQRRHLVVRKQRRPRVDRCG